MTGEKYNFISYNGFYEYTTIINFRGIAWPYKNLFVLCNSHTESFSIVIALFRAYYTSSFGSRKNNTWSHSFPCVSPLRLKFRSRNISGLCFVITLVCSFELYNSTWVKQTNSRSSCNYPHSPPPVSLLVYHRTRRTEVHKHLIPNSPSNFRQSQHAQNTCTRRSLSTKTWHEPLPEDKFTAGICQDVQQLGPLKAIELKAISWWTWDVVSDPFLCGYCESCCGYLTIFSWGLHSGCGLGACHSFLHSPVKWK